MYLIKRSILIGFLLLCPITISAYGIYLGERPSSEPYLSGDTFRKHCDIAFDIKNRTLNPDTVQCGDIIFVATDDGCLDEFLERYHPLIKVPYILLTHNGDMNITEKFKPYLDDPKIYRWLAQNVGYIHPKLIPIPIGLENKLWGRHYDELINELKAKGVDREERVYLAHLNCSVTTNPTERIPVYHYFSKQPFCYCPPKKSNQDYLRDVCHAKYIISPHGNGLDCHRTWEGLYLGAFAVVKASTLDALYDDLPVIIVQEWQQVTQEFLEKKFEEMRTKTFKVEKLYINYWIEVFNQLKVSCLDSCGE